MFAKSMVQEKKEDALNVNFTNHLLKKDVSLLFILPEFLLCGMSIERPEVFILWMISIVTRN